MRQATGSLVTHLFPAGADSLGSDVVFSAKPELIVEFERNVPGPKPDGGKCEVPWLLTAHYFVLQPQTT